MSDNIYVKELRQFIGLKVSAIVESPPGEFDEDVYFGFKFDMGRGKPAKYVWFMQDDEGNGPGSFHIQTEGEDGLSSE